jgi:hypothetical protein
VKRGNQQLSLAVTLARLNTPSTKKRLLQNRSGVGQSRRHDDFPLVLQHDTVLRPVDCGGPLVDLSGSMDEPGIYSLTRFTDAQSAALEFVNTKLQDGDLVGVVGFGSEVYDGDWIHLTSDRDQAATLIQGLTPYTDPKKFNTALWSAGFKALRMFDEHPDETMRQSIDRMRRAVVAFTDGNDTISISNPGDLAIWARDRNISFNTVGLKSPPGVRVRYKAEDEDARWLAEQTLGEYFDFGDAARRNEFSIFLDRLAAQRDQLRISYQSQAEEGEHTTRVVVATGTDSQEAEVSWVGGGEALTAKLVEPVAGSSYGCSLDPQMVAIRAEVVSQDNAEHLVDQVEFYKNGELLGTVYGSPYEWMWDVSQEEPGSYELTAVLHDATLDEIVNVTPIVVKVEPPAPAQVRFSSPAAGTTILRESGAVLTLAATVTFPDDCTREVVVRFKGDGEAIPGSKTATSPYRYRWDVSELAEGSHRVSLELLDPAYSAPIPAGPISFTIIPTPWDIILAWLEDNWPLLLLSFIVLFVFILLLRTRRRVGSAVGQAVVRVRNTLVGQPTAEALGTLKAVRGPVEGRSYRLTERINTIGRDPQRCEVAIRDDGYISTTHCRIEFTDHDVRLSDLHSRHGTVLNGQNIPPDQVVALADGDRIRVGETELEFKLPSRKGTRIVRRD